MSSEVERLRAALEAIEAVCWQGERINDVRRLQNILNNIRHIWVRPALKRNA